MASKKSTTGEKNIKNYNHYLWIFFIVNISIYFCILKGKDVNLNNVNTFYISLTLKDGVLVAISTIITLSLNGILTSNFKHVIVFWKTKNPLPSCRIFTKLIDRDYRIDKSVLKDKYGILPINPDEQSMLWYKIYKPNEFEPMIFESQHSFLLFRDLTGISFLILFILPTVALLQDVKVTTVLIYILFLLVEYLTLAVVSQNYGNRFTCNVLALDCINK